MSDPINWDELRKEARRLESELDYKLSSFSKLCSAFETNYRFSGPDNLYLGLEQTQVRGDEIRSILRQLLNVNNEMSVVVGNASDSRIHILARHRDILIENTQVFEKSNSILSIARDKAQLLGPSHLTSAPHIGLNMGGLLRDRSSSLNSASGFSSGSNGGGGSLGALGLSGSNATGGMSPHSSILQSSIHSSIQNSSSLVDALLAQSAAVSSSLGEQRRTFEAASEKLFSLGARLPVVNGVINAIRRKKSKDTIILASTIFFCILVMFIVRFRYV
uniref:Golgi SNAP receptor complex member 1 n=1 Tax=Polytomella parva TaxID=51329 RepID=A0A7S0VMV1_9CHLO|mmetsp:Transcript_9512/g.17797  ORF Transcript_9512/g.17797 Transcript_9512/m.17797 type:complete len:276 (+) Transcript_9512:52-879(+)